MCKTEKKSSFLHSVLRFTFYTSKHMIKENQSKNENCKTDVKCKTGVKQKKIFIFTICFTFYVLHLKKHERGKLIHKVKIVKLI